MIFDDFSQDVIGDDQMPIFKCKMYRKLEGDLSIIFTSILTKRKYISSRFCLIPFGESELTREIKCINFMLPGAI